ncbi:hypothetical protein H4219_000936 [Mycoemilia scoparia]|uniref:Uncharacterized protein n=1 Tax=Mycoemilia scoparia TaxID=417184 RepID=A0A9W8A1P8_9FUNG|nr:hypothetical protein H4219_000936 [Mycoemilia scoparia]
MTNRATNDTTKLSEIKAYDFGHATALQAAKRAGSAGLGGPPPPQKLEPSAHIVPVAQIEQCAQDLARFAAFRRRHLSDLPTYPPSRRPSMAPTVHENLEEHMRRHSLISAPLTEKPLRPSGQFKRDVIYENRRKPSTHTFAAQLEKKVAFGGPMPTKTRKSKIGGSGVTLPTSGIGKKAVFEPTSVLTGYNLQEASRNNCRSSLGMMPSSGHRRQRTATGIECSNMKPNAPQTAKLGKHIRVGSQYQNNTGERLIIAEKSHRKTTSLSGANDKNVDQSFLVYKSIAYKRSDIGGPLEKTTKSSCIGGTGLPHTAANTSIGSSLSKV